MNSRSVIHVIDQRTAYWFDQSMLFRYSLSEPFIGVSGLIINYSTIEIKLCISIIKDFGKILLRSVVLFDFTTWIILQ